MSSNYDTIIIGAGMSGLAAGIRLAMYDKKVLILEKHTISGGLNSYYARGKRKFDVGLHAMTNFVKKGDKAKPMTKLLKQLRIGYDELLLSEQNKSLIKFKSESLYFNNEFDFLVEQIRTKFPNDVDSFLKFVTYIKEFNEVALDNKTYMAKDVAYTFISNPLLVEMIFAPLLIYGSAWENDMDFSQFVIMFKSIYLEGFCRPDGGVRTIINLLLDKYKALGGELRFKSGVAKIHDQNGAVTSVELENGEILYTSKIISSIGHPETMNIAAGYKKTQLPPVGSLSFCESILCLDKMPKDFGIDETIIFYNENDVYEYKKASGLYDTRSAVICFPNNFMKDTIGEAIARVTYIANYNNWKELDKTIYKEKKQILAQDSLNTIKAIAPNFDAKIEFMDVFTPTTIERYTGHFQGCVYGSTDKIRDGKTSIKGLYLCGTDQGFLGIVGSMLSGISMANLHGLMQE